MKEHFDSCVKKVLKMEGGYVNDRDDPGGETNFGITIATARRGGYMSDMKDMVREDAEAIYYNLYWTPLRLNDVEDEDLCLELFDTGVNMGLRRPVEWLQEDLNALNNQEKLWQDILEDGKIGPKTVGTLNGALRIKNMKDRLLKLLNADQTVKYKNITRKRETSEKFIGGWLDHRVKFSSGGYEKSHEYRSAVV